MFATMVIGEGVKMGPYVGKRVYMEEMGNFINTAYAWEVSGEIEGSINELLLCCMHGSR